MQGETGSSQAPGPGLHVSPHPLCLLWTSAERLTPSTRFGIQLFPRSAVSRRCVHVMAPSSAPPHPQVGLLGVRPLWPFLGVLWVAAADYGPTFPSFLLNYDVCVMKATALYCKIFVGCYFHVMSLIPLAISFKKLSKLRYNSHIIKFAPFQCMICPGW